MVKTAERAESCSTARGRHAGEQSVQCTNQTMRRRKRNYEQNVELFHGELINVDVDVALAEIIDSLKCQRLHDTSARDRRG